MIWDRLSRDSPPIPAPPPPPPPACHAPVWLAPGTRREGFPYHCVFFDGEEGILRYRGANPFFCGRAFLSLYRTGRFIGEDFILAIGDLFNFSPIFKTPTKYIRYDTPTIIVHPDVIRQSKIRQML